MTAFTTTVVIGPTGSGKTVRLRTEVLNGIRDGRDVVIVDTTKGCVDFADLAPHVRLVSTREDALALLRGPIEPWTTVVIDELSSAAHALGTPLHEALERLDADPPP